MVDSTAKLPVIPNSTSLDLLLSTKTSLAILGPAQPSLTTNGQVQILSPAPQTPGAPGVETSKRRSFTTLQGNIGMFSPSVTTSRLSVDII